MVREKLAVREKLIKKRHDQPRCQRSCDVVINIQGKSFHNGRGNGPDQPYLERNIWGNECDNDGAEEAAQSPFDRLSSDPDPSKSPTDQGSEDISDDDE